MASVEQLRTAGQGSAAGPACLQREVLTIDQTMLEPMGPEACTWSQARD